MSKEALVAFLRRVAEDERLRVELAAVADRHGFRFTAAELGTVDFAGASEQVAARSGDEDDEERTDPGFGMIEYPG